MFSRLSNLKKKQNTNRQINFIRKTFQEADEFWQDDKDE